MTFLKNSMPLPKTFSYSPFADIDVNCTFISPSKREVSIPAFYDGSSTWRGAFSGLCVMNDFENDKEKLLDWVLVLGAKE